MNDYKIYATVTTTVEKNVAGETEQQARKKLRDTLNNSTALFVNDEGNPKAQGDVFAVKVEDVHKAEEDCGCG